jgi:hypothetical protein
MYGYRYGYAITSFAVFLGQCMFFLGYESFRRSIYFPHIRITERSYSRLFLVLFPLLALIWTARYILLSAGSYYHIYRSEYQFASPFYSVFVQLNGYGLIIVGALFLIAFSEQREKEKIKKATIAIFVFIIEIFWYFPAGLREPIAMTVLAPIFAYMFINRKVPKKAIAVLIIASFPIFAILGEYRYVVPTYFPISRISPETAPSAILEARERLKDQNVNIVTNLTDRLYDGKNFGYLLMHYSNDYDYEFGATYKNILFAAIPRFIYPEKPVFTTPLGRWYQLVEGGSTPITFWGESYINFSWVGIIIVSYILGLGIKMYDYLFIRKSSKPYWVYLYIFGAIHMIRLPVQAGVIWVSFLLKVIVLAVIYTSIHIFLTRIIHQQKDISL